jgi:hypothetical protein
MRALLGILTYGVLTLGTILFIAGLVSSNSALWIWGLLLLGVGIPLRLFIAFLNRAELRMITERAVRGVGPVPPQHIQRLIMQGVKRTTLSGEAPTTSLIENYTIAVQQWSLQQGRPGE